MKVVNVLNVESRVRTNNTPSQKATVTLKGQALTRQGYLSKIKSAVVNLFDSRTPLQKAMDTACKRNMAMADAIQAKIEQGIQKECLSLLNDVSKMQK